METQNEMILTYLKVGNTLTPLEALEKFGCFRLGARVHDLKAQGHDIISRMVKRNGKWIAQYSLFQEVSA